MVLLVCIYEKYIYSRRHKCHAQFFFSKIMLYMTICEFVIFLFINICIPILDLVVPITLCLYRSLSLKNNIWFAMCVCARVFFLFLFFFP